MDPVWRCGFDGCDRVYLSERGIRRHYILQHRHKYRRGQAPIYIHDDDEYERLRLRLHRGQRHRHPQTGSDDEDDGNGASRRSAAPVSPPEAVYSSTSSVQSAKVVGGPQSRMEGPGRSRGVERPSHGSTDRSRKAHSRQESVGHAERSRSRSGTAVGSAKQARKSSHQGTAGTSRDQRGSREKSGATYQRSSSRIRNQRERQRQAERDRPGRAGSEMSHQGQGQQTATYGQYVGPAGQFLVPQYSADGRLLGVQTAHRGQSSQAAGSSGSRSERDTGHKAKVQHTGQYQGSSEPARGDRRGSTVEPPRQSSFTEVRGKRQQYDIDIVDISDDDDDAFADVGRSNVYHWHQPARPSREPPSHTMTMAEVATFGLQERGPTVTHHTIPAGEESDSDGLSSPVYDPFRIEEREDVSSGHELDTVVTGLGPGYDVLPDVELLTPSMPLLEPEVMAAHVAFIAEPLSQAESTGMRDVAVGDDELQPWYSLPVGVSLH